MKLEPCPFCGGDWRVVVDDLPESPERGFCHASCTGCGMGTPICECGTATGSDKPCEHVIAAVNRRALERLKCYKCGALLDVYGPAGTEETGPNPGMEICYACHEEIVLDGRADGWVSVEDRLPEVAKRVIVYDAFYGKVRQGWNTGKKDDHGRPRLVLETSDDCYVTHWRPLPAPPETE